MKDKYYYECTNCKSEYPASEVIYRCPACEKENVPNKPAKGVLKVIYDYNAIRSRFSVASLFTSLRDERFLSLLPLRNMQSWPVLRIGNTPLYKTERHASSKINFDLFLKDDSQNPTFSFKDRASALVSAWAKENNIQTIIAASTGNAGSSLAGICASQGQRSYIFVPASAPLAKLTQILMYGSTLIPVKGNYDQAFDLSIKATELFGFYNRNTAYNPMTIEGKKTVAFEIYNQLNLQVPDLIFIPVGDGVILSGVYKGFEDLMKLGITGKMPKIIAVQAEGSNNLIRNISGPEFSATPSSTIADSISVDVPANFYMSVNFLKNYHGESITVTDDEILQGSIHLSQSMGIFTEPASAAAYSAMLKFRVQGKIVEGSKVVILLTGSGLKDLASVQSSIQIPHAIDPDVNALKQVIHQ